jgi:deoxyribodipyrimidine photolyase-related protein
VSRFVQALAERQADPAGRRWLFVPYDQLSDRIGPLSREAPGKLGIVVVESLAKARRRPYHKQKLAIILTNLRHFCLEQAARGVAVRHVFTKRGYRDALGSVIKELGPLRVMMPAERELRSELEPLAKRGAITIEPHEGWLTTRDDFRESHPNGPPWRMDRFYRHVRKRTGVLMDGDKPIGGKFSFDTENRKTWRGEPAAPRVPRFRVDAITDEVLEFVEQRFAQHPGQLDSAAIPATREQARRAWRWALDRCLPHFGPFQDAMSTASSSLFHARISHLLNIGRLLPADVVRDVERCELPLPSKEGFIRQVLGWREFVHHVHEVTDGFRDLPGGAPSAAPGDAPARPSLLGAHEPLPPAFWGEASGLACLDVVVREVWREGYGHHITRLMVLSNLATMLDVEPRELTDWFWVAYVDAFDWVVEPNVLGMGTFAVGELMTTKPYVAGAAYIDKMGDFCRDCAFDPKRDCPIRSLYWAFLARHRRQLRDNPRLSMPFRSLARRSPAARRRDRETFAAVGQRLRAGERLEPTAEEKTRDG